MLDRLIAACDRYMDWYARSRWGRIHFPQCPMCRSRKHFRLIGTPALVNYRYQDSRVRQRVLCTNCGMSLSMSRHYGSGKWSFTDV